METFSVFVVARRLLQSKGIASRLQEKPFSSRTRRFSVLYLLVFQVMLFFVASCKPASCFILGRVTLLERSNCRFIAFDEVERKPNLDLWLSRVGGPVHGSRPKNPHSCKDTKMATPLDFCRGMSQPVNWYRLMLRHVIRHVANM